MFTGAADGVRAFAPVFPRRLGHCIPEHGGHLDQVRVALGQLVCVPPRRENCPAVGVQCQVRLDVVLVGQQVADQRLRLSLGSGGRAGVDLAARPVRGSSDFPVEGKVSATSRSSTRQ